MAGGTPAAAAEIDSSYKGVEVIEESEGITSSFVSENRLSRATDGAYDGGWWYRGKSGSLLVSEYKHYKKEGRASCRNGNSDYSDGGWNPVNHFSKANVSYSKSGNKVYYDYR
ncbi:MULTISPECIES: bacteriocin [unclassified Enterococcus]|uniref:bacteriocin n=1 Tax=unclassified Enterococcus TaxID=2608891 RepID=UPI0024731BC4|nr:MULTISPECIES: bacteriocin [unclassified Enterococcus]